MKYKFEVGDIVVGIPGNTYSITSEGWKGEVIETYEDRPSKIRVRDLKYQGEEFTDYSTAPDSKVEGYVVAAKHFKLIERKGKDNMIEKAKSLATQAHESFKPYQKYIGLLALAIVIDHFFLNNACTDKFKDLATTTVNKIHGMLDAFIEKICGEKVDEEAPEEVPPEEAATETDDDKMFHGQ